eukprot:Phypoly_transcript_10477.p1 GENE.Phypoly_transcript_10477~~Phypoly_transcript_10477.p1  ORF type:complete len:377 (+),score=69.05 Phypoly_transcript_10477:93-1223(+)
MIRVLIAFDKFKDCMGAEALGNICASSLSHLFPNKITSTVMPLSDGGEGFVEALKNPLKLDIKTISVTGPLGTPVSAQYGQHESVAVIEMAQASGIEKVPKEKRNPFNTTTHGTGDLIMDAYKHGARKFVVGVGGSATNDGGIGALRAIGLKVDVDEGNKIIQPDIIYGKHLTHLRKLTAPEKLLPGATFEIACDVTSPFVGPSGATYTFGPQKGANEQDREVLESGMNKLAKLYQETFGVDISNMPGAGAAGGLSGGLVAALGGQIKKGIDVIFQEYKVDEAIANSDLVLTGEGSYDKTTKAGKLVQHIRDLGKKHNVPVVVLCGRKKDTDETDTHIYDLMSVAQNEQEAMKETEKCLRKLISERVKEFPVLQDL